MTPATDTPTERFVHRVAGALADVLWAVAGKVTDSADQVEQIGNKIAEAGHSILNIAISYSEWIHDLPPDEPGPPLPLIITKYEFPPLNLCHGSELLNLTGARDVSIVSQDGLIERSVPILDHYEGQISMDGILCLPPGHYDVMVTWGDNEIQVIDTSIQIQDASIRED